MGEKAMKNVVGGLAPLDDDDKPCVKCCTNEKEEDCTECEVGIGTCRRGVTIKCPRNQDGTCKV